MDAIWVEFGQDGQADHIAPLDVRAGPPWEIDLLGMKQGSDYDVRVGVQIDGESYTGSSQTVSTGMVPADFPDMILERGSGESFDGFFYTSVVGLTTAAVIIDTDGDYVWWYRPEGIEWVGRTFPSVDGSSILTMDENLDGVEGGAMVRVALDGSSEEITELDYAHHEIVEHDDGTIAYLAKDPKNINGVLVSGESIVELAPDGTATTVWSVWNHDERLPYEPEDELHAQKWPHGNALDYLPDEDAYLVSFLYLDAIARVDRGTGSIDWVMGGPGSDFTTADGSTDLFERTHQMHRLEDSMLVFVNGESDGGLSFAVEYAMDLQSFVVESVWEHWPDPSLSSFALGDVHRFDNGNTLVTFSYSGEIQEVTPDGAVVWALSTNVGHGVSYVTPVEDLYAH